jgi:hypothetical protein
MGFKEIKHHIIDCLEQGNVSHEQRNNINIKNLLATGDITTKEVIDILKKSRGSEHQSSPHYYDSNINVHIIKTSYSGVKWYIKWYFIAPNSIFISIH